MMEKDPTLEYYRENAVPFAAGTADADMGETRERFLALLPPGGRILDFGCGSGRDTKAFLELGYEVEASDGSEELCRIASEQTGIEVKQQLFGELEETDRYDGIWACASILHLPREELIEVLERVSRAMRKDGILYTSFKYGTFEGMRNGRYFTDFTEETLLRFWKDVEGLEITELWSTGDVRPGKEEERWINILARRV